MRRRALTVLLIAHGLLGLPAQAQVAPAPMLSVQPVWVSLVGASPAGIAWWRNLDTRRISTEEAFDDRGRGSVVEFRAFSSAAVVRTDLEDDYGCSNHAGDRCPHAEVVGANLVRIDQDIVTADCDGTYYDIPSGSRHTLPMLSDDCAQALGDGSFAIVTAYDPDAGQATLAVRRAGEPDRPVGAVPGYPGYQAAGDPAGLLYRERMVLWYVDLATGAYRKVADSSNHPALTASWIAWYDDGAIHRQPRAGGPTTSWNVGPIVDYAISESHVAWTTADGTLRAAPVASGGTPTLARAGHREVAAIAGARFAVVGRDPVGRTQIQVLDAGSGATEVFETIAVPAEHALALGPGRLVDVHDAAEGGEMVIRPLSGGPPETWRQPTPSAVLSVSGDHVATGAIRSGGFELTKDGLRRVGGVATLPPGGTPPVDDDLWGPYVGSRAGRRDLRTGRVTPLRRTDAQMSCCVRERTRLWGDWAVTDAVRDGFHGVVVPPRVHHVPSGRSFDVPGVARGMAVPDLAIGDGVLAYALRNPGGAPTADLMVLDLTRPGAVPVRLGSFGDNRNKILEPGPDDDVQRRSIAVDDARVAWPGPDGVVRVEPLSFDVGGAPRVLGWSGPSAFSPDGDRKGDVWDPEIDVTKPLPSWRLELRDARGTVVRAFAGSAPLGTVHARWDGRDGAGRAVPDGRYVWTLTGALDADARAPQRGVVVVDRGPLTARLAVSRVSAVEDPTGGVVVHVGHDAQPGVTVRADVSYRGFVNGAWTPTTRLATDSAATRYAIPGALPQGSTWQVFVTLRDSVGHTASAAAVSGVPLDERNPRIRYLAGWNAPAAMAGRYLGTGRSASRPANADLVVDGSEVHVLADRCPTCADVRLYVDGVLAGTFSAYAPADRPRSVVGSARMPRGRHGIRVEVVPRPGRARFVLDGVAVLM